MKTIVAELGSIVAEIYEERLTEALKKNEDIAILVLEIEKYLHQVGVEAVKKVMESANAHILESHERRTGISKLHLSWAVSTPYSA
jgi:hypothetical protein